MGPQPEPNPRNVIIHGNARFTFLSEATVRLEWAEDGQFEDRASIAAVNRNTPDVEFRSKTARGGTLLIETSRIKLTYRPDGRPFSKKNLSIQFKCGAVKGSWAPGQKDPLNLGSTIRTLDNSDGCYQLTWKQKNGEWYPAEPKKIKVPPGLLSRSGWTLMEDTGTILLTGDPNSADTWVTPRPAGKRIDWYFFAYGTGYKEALKEAATIFGALPIPPRFAFGYWYSRYWAYTDREISDLVQHFDAMHVPLDVMVIDMDWHLPGWTGYSWDRRYFPDPSDFLKQLHKHGLKITLNLHPADGVGKHEDAFLPMCKELGLDPEKTGKIPFDVADPDYMRAYFKHLHNPEEDRGVDFWWIDWQQGTNSKIPGLDPLTWLNHEHWINQATRRPERRPLNFSRYHGLGAGRYPIGFSGDTASSWETLKHQVQFTSRSSNILYGYWSHDVGGHFGPKFEPELYMRWVQYAVYLPVMRTHTTKDPGPNSERRFWAFGEPFGQLMIEAVRRRYALVPYIYSEARQTFETGVSLTRPMYYEWPEHEEAYQATDQFYFGSQLLVAPVVSPIKAKDRMAEVSIWLPPGAWIDTELGDIVEGDRWVKRQYLYDETPVFVRPGTVLPEQGKTLRLDAESYPSLVAVLFTGASGEYDLYEDDGKSTAYQQEGFARIPIRQEHGDRETLVRIGPAKGSYPGFLSSRPVDIRLHGVIARRAQFGAHEIQWSHREEGRCWRLDPDTLDTIVHLGPIDLTKETIVRIERRSGVHYGLMPGWVGLHRRLERIRRRVCQASPAHTLHPEERLIVELAQTGNRICRNPASAEAELAVMQKGLDRLPQVLREYHAAFKKRGGRTQMELLKEAIQILDRTLKQFPIENRSGAHRG